MSTKNLFLTVLLLCPLCFNAYAEKNTVGTNEPPTLMDGAQTSERSIKRQVVDIEGEAKKKLTVEDLLKLFISASGSEFADDRTMLS